MRILLLAAALATSIASEWSHSEGYVDPLREYESIDSVFEKKAYFAFKLKNEKVTFSLIRRVVLIQELSKQRMGDELDTKYADEQLSSSFVLPSSLELVIASFYYDEDEHKERFNTTFAAAAHSLCATFPRYLTFDRFVLCDGQIIGRLQDADIDRAPVMAILNHHGFTYHNVSDVIQGEHSGFVAVRQHDSLMDGSPLPDSVNVFLEKPLRTSVYVDTLYACIANSSGSCDEIASMKIEDCKNGKEIL